MSRVASRRGWFFCFFHRAAAFARLKGGREDTMAQLCSSRKQVRWIVCFVASRSCHALHWWVRFSQACGCAYVSQLGFLKAPLQYTGTRFHDKRVQDGGRERQSSPSECFGLRPCWASLGALSAALRGVRFPEGTQASGAQKMCLLAEERATKTLNLCRRRPLRSCTLNFVREKLQPHGRYHAYSSALGGQPLALFKVASIY